MAFDGRNLPGLPAGETVGAHPPAAGPWPCVGDTRPMQQQLVDAAAAVPSHRDSPPLYGSINVFQPIISTWSLLIVLLVLVTIIALVAVTLKQRCSDAAARRRRSASRPTEEDKTSRVDDLPAMEEGVWVTNPDGSVEVAHALALSRDKDQAEPGSSQPKSSL